ncbi:hypothetical protein SH611_14045 [Geminicoccaceae bacterium 1502E]|nr:hypothetical protein [Geminicoccaceae bacterium 1502E]
MPRSRAEDADMLLIRPNGEQVVLRAEGRSKNAPAVPAEPWRASPARPGDRRLGRRLPDAAGRGVVLDLLA